MLTLSCTLSCTLALRSARPASIRHVAGVPRGLTGSGSWCGARAVDGCDAFKHSVPPAMSWPRPHQHHHLPHTRMRVRRRLSTPAGQETGPQCIEGVGSGVAAAVGRRGRRRGRGKRSRGEFIPWGEGPFNYHDEVQVTIDTLTNLGEGVARVKLEEIRTVPSTGEKGETDAGAGYVILVPGVLPGETVCAYVCVCLRVCWSHSVTVCGVRPRVGARVSYAC